MKDKMTIEKNMEEQFKVLKEHIGEEIVIQHYEYGKLYCDVHRLREVYDYKGISCDICFLVFIGNSCAITKILTRDGQVLYEAKGLDEPYEYYDDHQLIEVIRKVFGNNQAEIAEKELIEYEKKQKEMELKRKEYIVNFQEEVLPQIIRETKPLIKEELYQDWVKFLNNNSEDVYCIAIVKMIVSILFAINSGMSYKEALDKASEEYHSSGYADSMAASIIRKYSIFGEEYKRFWNSQYGEENADGVINPSIIHIKR